MERASISESATHVGSTADLEKGKNFPRTDTVRFGPGGISGLGTVIEDGRRPLERNMSIGSTQRPRFSQSARIKGEFRTLSLQLSEGDVDKTKKVKKSGDRKALTELADLDWHKLSIDEVLSRLGASPISGLDGPQAQRRIASDGPNVISKPPNRWFRKIMTYIFGGFGSLLIGAGIICIVAWRIGVPMQASNLALGIVLFVVVIITSFFNAWQDFTTSRVMESVRGMLPSDVPVIRDGSLKVIPAADLARGDIISIKMGQKVPADCRVLSIDSELKFDRSSLTGESDAIAAALDCTEDNYLETRNILLAGTKCVSGDGKAIVIATGDRTVFGRLAKLSSTPKTERTTLENEIFWFVSTIASIAFVVAIVCVIIWAAYLRPRYPNFMSVSALLVNVVSILVAFIPEGLPAAVSLSLTAVAARMRRAKVLVKSLAIVETLGAVNVVCSDKTGTLTQNNMTVQSCGFHGLTEDSNPDEAQRQIALQTPLGIILKQLQWIAAVCNAAVFEESTLDLPLAQRKIHGDATDTACLRFAQQLRDIKESNDGWETIEQMAFNSKNKFALRLLKNLNPGAIPNAIADSTFNPNTDIVLLSKGAPDVLMARSSSVLDASGQVLPLTPERAAYLSSVQQRWASKGQRVLLLARRIISSSQATGINGASLTEHELIALNTDLTVVGLVGIVDPPRPEIPEVVKTVRGAGSRFFMVTGDFQATAVAIARQCGIITAEKVMTFDDLTQVDFPTYNFLDDNDARDQRALSLTGTDIMRLQPEDWEKVCNFDEIVFSRTTPDQKLRIVKEFQKRDGVVAMTGDGVNDAPALKQADCGIAMGGGSEVAIEAADLVLLDSFSSFVDALLWGRVCFDNLKKTVAYLLPAGSFAELWAVLLSFFFGLPQALSNIQMILVCVFTDLFPALSLIQEKPEADVLKRKPRNTKKDRLANPQLLFHAYFIVGVPLTLCSSSMAFWYMQRNGVPFYDMYLKYGLGEVQSNNPDYFNEIVNQANAVYFFTLVIQQFFDLLAIRTRRLSLFQQWPFWGPARNVWIIPAIVTSFLLAVFFSYIPAIQHVFLTRGVSAEHYFIPMAFGVVTLTIDELRKLVVRTYPQSFIARIAW